jgi:hypothetical protein
MIPDFTIARLSGKAWKAAVNSTGSGDPLFFVRSWAIALISIPDFFPNRDLQIELCAGLNEAIGKRKH